LTNSNINTNMIFLSVYYSDIYWPIFSIPKYVGKHRQKYFHDIYWENRSMKWRNKKKPSNTMTWSVEINIFKLLMMGLPKTYFVGIFQEVKKRITANINVTINSPMKSVRRCISENWKRIIANAIATHRQNYI
jgi:hypothetical protein